jgi:cytochrome c oxidase cbb3-type subunit I/II
MYEPGDISTGSIMPSYKWLFEQTIDKNATAGKISALRTIGVPYDEGYEELANVDLEMQANQIVSNLKKDNIEIAADAEIVALIAYLQRLGRDIKADKTADTIKP